MPIGSFRKWVEDGESVEDVIKSLQNPTLLEPKHNGEKTMHTKVFEVEIGLYVSAESQDEVLKLIQPIMILANQLDIEKSAFGQIFDVEHQEDFIRQ